MLKKKVLVNGISNLSDARYCAGMMVDYLCFEMNPSHEDFISIEKVTEIKNWISGPKIGGRFSEWPKEFDWEAFQPDFLIITSNEALDRAVSFADEIFIERNEGERVELIWKNNRELETEEKLEFFRVNKSEDLTEDFLQNEGLAGVSLRGSQEDRPGFSDYGELMDILEVLEEE